MNLKFYTKLYLGKDIEDENDIINKIEDGQKIFNLYLICVKKKSTNLFEFFRQTSIYNDIYLDKDYIVIGMTYGYENAKKIIYDIFSKYICANKNISDIKLDFIKNICW